MLRGASLGGVRVSLGEIWPATGVPSPLTQSAMQDKKLACPCRAIKERFTMIN
ncbi:MAG: hypothetical protein O7I93_01660 [Gemmatimonadetes bacterium]|nr:hypothetical protein [Gemmatimonadota bacterium]